MFKINEKKVFTLLSKASYSILFFLLNKPYKHILWQTLVYINNIFTFVHKYILLYCSFKHSPYYLFTFFVKGQMYPNSPSSVWKTCMCVCDVSPGVAAAAMQEAGRLWWLQTVVIVRGQLGRLVDFFFVRGRGKWRRSLFVQRKEVSRMRSTCRGYNYLPARVCVYVFFFATTDSGIFFFMV